MVEGVFQDEHGRYPAGSYFRNPPGTSHVPASEDGCTIFVRLWQFRAADQAQIVRQPGEGLNVEPRPGASTAILVFADGYEQVRIEDWVANKDVTVTNERGLEFLVLSGSLVVSGERLEAQSWGRLPARMPLRAVVGPQGARVWMKDATLLHPAVCTLPG